MAFGWFCNAVIVHIWEIAPSTPCCRALALLYPLTIISTLLAAMTVPTPTVSAVSGTFVMSPPKNREFAILVSRVSVFILVREASDDPGSLKAICPSGPTPPRKRSMPPYEAIFSSYLRHSSSGSAALPLRMLTFSFLMSIWLKKLFHMKEW